MFKVEVGKGPVQCISLLQTYPGDDSLMKGMVGMLVRQYPYFNLPSVSGAGAL